MREAQSVAALGRNEPNVCKKSRNTTYWLRFQSQVVNWYFRQWSSVQEGSLIRDEKKGKRYIFNSSRILIYGNHGSVKIFIIVCLIITALPVAQYTYEAFSPLQQPHASDFALPFRFASCPAFGLIYANLWRSGIVLLTQVLPTFCWLKIQPLGSENSKVNRNVCSASHTQCWLLVWPQFCSHHEWLLSKLRGWLPFLFFCNIQPKFQLFHNTTMGTT